MQNNTEQNITKVMTILLLRYNLLGSYTPFQSHTHFTTTNMNGLHFTTTKVNHLKSPMFANCQPLIQHSVNKTVITYTKHLSLILCAFIQRFTDSYWEDQSLLPLIQNLSLYWTRHPANSSSLQRTLRTPLHPTKLEIEPHYLFYFVL